MITIQDINQIDYYKEQGKIPEIKFRTAGRALGVTAWGMNILDLDANTISYPEHDHIKDGQEEVYILLEGSAKLIVDGKEHDLTPQHIMRITADSRRKFIAGAKGCRILAIGAKPGEAFKLKVK